MSQHTSSKRQPTSPVSPVDEAEAKLRSMVAERRRAGEARLPTEKDLAAQLGASLYAVREALTRLETDGQVERRKRLGTLITGTAQQEMPSSLVAYPITLMLSLPEYLQAIGVQHSVLAVAVRRDPATEAVATALGIDPGTDVFLASRHYEVTGKPAAVLEHWVPTLLDGHDVHIGELTEGVTTFLRESEQVDLTHVETTVTAEAAGAEVAQQLQLETGAPLLVVHARLYSRGQAAVAVGRLVFRPDVLCLSASASENEQPDLRAILDTGPLVTPMPPPDTNSRKEMS